MSDRELIAARVINKFARKAKTMKGTDVILTTMEEVEKTHFKGYEKSFMAESVIKLLMVGADDLLHTKTVRELQTFIDSNVLYGMFEAFVYVSKGKFRINTYRKKSSCFFLK